MRDCYRSQSRRRLYGSRVAVDWMSRLLCFLCFCACQPAAAGQTASAVQLSMLNRALAAAERGQLDEALRLDSQLLARSPALLPALKLRGALLEQMGRAPEADEAYVQALRVAPRDADLRIKRAELALQRNNDQIAIEELRLYCKLRPADATGFFYLAQALHRSSQFDEAMKELRQAIRLEPQSAAFLQKLGEWLTASGNARDGAVTLAKARRIDPALERIDFDLGLAAYYELDYARAVQEAEAALTRTPGDASALQLLAPPASSFPTGTKRWPSASGNCDPTQRMPVPCLAPVMRNWSWETQRQPSNPFAMR